jgi:hypothetical protein
MRLDIDVPYIGPARDMGLFELKWEKKGLREAKSNKDWAMWKELP